MAESKEKSVFEILNAVDVSEHKEDKPAGNGKKLSYLSWAWAWSETKKRFPDVNYKVYENEMGFPYHTDGRTAWVKCGVTIQGVEQIEYLSIMDNRNQSIPLDKVQSTDVIRTLQRCVTKAIGRHGLGLYIYAGEDLPEDAGEASEENASEKPQKASKTAKKNQEVKQPIDELPSDYCTICRLPVTDFDGKMKSGDPVHYSKEDIISRSTTAYGSPVCMSCMMKKMAKTKQNKEVSNE